jgi:hypothetical protein
MRLSLLQKYILQKCWEDRSYSANKNVFYGFYPAAEFKDNLKTIQKTVHKSLETLVERDLIVAYGKKTAEKFFINKVRLTREGVKASKDIVMAKQGKLPLGRH